MRIQVPVVFIKSRPQLEFQASSLSNFKYVADSRLLIIQVVPMAEPIMLQIIWMQKTYRICLFVMRMIFDDL